MFRRMLLTVVVVGVTWSGPVMAATDMEEIGLWLVANWFQASVVTILLFIAAVLGSMPIYSSRFVILAGGLEDIDDKLGKIEKLLESIERRT